MIICEKVYYMEGKTFRLNTQNRRYNIIMSVLQNNTEGVSIHYVTAPIS